MGRTLFLLSYGALWRARSRTAVAVLRAAHKNWRRSGEFRTKRRCSGVFVPRSPNLADRQECTAIKRSALCAETRSDRASLTPRAPPRAEDGRQRRRQCDAAEAPKNMPRSPDATKRRQFRSSTTLIAHWAHPGASMRRYGSPIA